VTPKKKLIEFVESALSRSPSQRRLPKASLPDKKLLQAKPYEIHALTELDSGCSQRIT
jgi:hypothetical protein